MVTKADIKRLNVLCPTLNEVSWNLLQNQVVNVFFKAKMITFLISKCARQAGWKVALSGRGGDELFGGYGSFSLLPKLSVFEKYLRALPRSWQIFTGNCLKRFLPDSDQNSKLAHFVRGQKSGSHSYFLLIHFGNTKIISVSW